LLTNDFAAMCRMMRLGPRSLWYCQKRSRRTENPTVNLFGTTRTRPWRPQSEHRTDLQNVSFGVGRFQDRAKSHRLNHTRKGRWFPTGPSALCFPQGAGDTGGLVLAAGRQWTQCQPAHAVYRRTGDNIFRSKAFALSCALRSAFASTEAAHVIDGFGFAPSSASSRCSIAVARLQFGPPFHTRQAWRYCSNASISDFVWLLVTLHTARSFLRISGRSFFLPFLPFWLQHRLHVSRNQVDSEPGCTNHCTNTRAYISSAATGTVYEV